MATFRQRPPNPRRAPDDPAAPTPPPAPHGRRGGAPAMLARATAQAGDGAGALFARLDAADAAEAAEALAATPPDWRRAEAERLLTRWAARIRAGEWNDGIAELVTLAQALERAYPPDASPQRQ